MQTEATTKNATGIIKRLWSSKFFWLVVFIATFNSAFQYFDPLDILGANTEAYQLVQGAVKEKSTALNALRQAPDVVLIGSSLPMAAAYYADCRYYLPAMKDWVKKCEAKKISAFQAYGQARYFEDQLSSACGRPVSVFNLTSAACMPSDAYLLLSNAVEHQPNLKTIIYGIAPRDFMDNLVPEVGLTPAFEVLAKPSSIQTAVTSDTPPPVAFEVAMSSLCSFYRQRINLRELASSLPSRFLNRETTLAKVAEKYGSGVSRQDARAPRLSPIKMNEVGQAGSLRSQASALQLKQRQAGSAGILPAPTPSVVQTDLAGHCKDYYKRYNPPNERRFRQELDQFRKILTLCRDRHIQLFVVNMPITGKNKELIDPQLYSRFSITVAKLPEQYGATFINMDDSTYDPARDYMDTVHLSDEGAPKLINRLVDKIKPRIVANEPALRP